MQEKGTSRRGHEATGGEGEPHWLLLLQFGGLCYALTPVSACQGDCLLLPTILWSYMQWEAIGSFLHMAGMI